MNRPEITADMITDIIKCYNRNFGGHYQFSSENAQSLALRMLLVAESASEVKTYMTVYRKTKGVVPFEALSRSFTTWIGNGRPSMGAMEDKPIGAVPVGGAVPPTAEIPVASATKAESPAPAPAANPKPSDMFEAFIKEIASHIDMPAVTEKVGAAALKWVVDQYGPVTKKVVVEVKGLKTEMDEILHEKFDEVVKYVANDIPVYLVGPAGSGKNVLCEQVAKALGYEFYFTNAVTQEYQLLGFTDAMGKYQATQFYKAWTEGGLFMCDELDGSIPEVLIKLNMGIANGYMDFPAPIGKVKKNPNFRLIAAGNTLGHGADFQYVGRTQLDAASLNRFADVRVDYDPRIEEALSRGDKDLLGFCRAFRAACKESGIGAIVSYRNIRDMAIMKDLLPTEDLLYGRLTAALDKHDLTILKGKCAGYGKYSAALAKLCDK